MRTEHVHALLPLWVEGDLSEAEAAEVREHLETCPACSRAAGELRASQAWLKEAPGAPFQEADHLELQHRVMARIRAEAPRSRRGSPWARGSLLVLAAAAGILAVLALQARKDGRIQDTSVTSAAQALPPWIAARPSDGRPAQAPADLSIQPRAPVGTPAAQARQHPAPHPPVGRPVPGSPGGPSRIEIQTRNPNVRIILLACSRPQPEPPTEDPSI